ncbi:MAG: L-threonylcarbamoyladenylate synthase, partial [Abditibacteriota bacterium]|nr:L-threonylcarbamoyladenylate synthase [Abditibacteriota bacterium]
VDRVENISRAARYTPYLSALEGEYMPGPVTVILRKKPRFHSLAAGGRKTVAVRIPDHAFLLSLLIMLEEPLAATSANLSGCPAPTSFEAIDQALVRQADMAINMGECSVGLSSTIIDLSEPEIRVLREGSVPGERLIKYLKETVL